jgi:molybdopterin-binding protein
VQTDAIASALSTTSTGIAREDSHAAPPTTMTATASSAGTSQCRLQKRPRNRRPRAAGPDPARTAAVQASPSQYRSRATTVVGSGHHPAAGVSWRGRAHASAAPPPASRSTIPINVLVTHGLSQACACGAGSYAPGVTYFRISEAAGLLGVSDDTVRRYVETERLPVERDDSNRQVIDGAALAVFARDHAHRVPDPSGVARSARNRLVGLVTAVQTDAIMAQVEMQCGPHRVVSLMSSEAARELGLEPGVLAIAVIKSTNVVVETPRPAR